MPDVEINSDFNRKSDATSLRSNIKISKKAAQVELGVGVCTIYYF